MGTEFHLQVLTANFGGYQSLRLAAEELVRRHPTFSLETHDFFANEAQEWMLRNGITRYPTIRLYREGKLLGESSIAVWSLYSLEMWILGYLSAPGSAQFRSHRYRLLARYRPRRHRYRARRRRSWTPPEQIELYPDYPRDQFGFIPKPRCYEVLTVMADYGLTYLWDMNWCCIFLESITGQAEELDVRLKEWASRFDNDFPDPKLFEKQPEERARFDAEGLDLARQAHRRLEGHKRVICRPVRGAVVEVGVDQLQEGSGSAHSLGS